MSLGKIIGRSNPETFLSMRNCFEAREKDAYLRVQAENGGIFVCLCVYEGSVLVHS